MVMLMDKKEEFKKFVKKNPDFADYVRNKTATWQELYELWDMYGEDESVFSKYKSLQTLSFPYSKTSAVLPLPTDFISCIPSPHCESSS